MDLYGQHSYLLQAEMKPGEAAAFQSLLLRSAEAKKPLLSRDYAAELRAHGAAPIQQVAVAFDGKRVLVGHARAPATKRRS